MSTSTSQELDIARPWHASTTGAASSRTSSAPCSKAPLARDAQRALGAHYTHEADIQKVVRPTIVEPWLERIENATKLRELQRLAGPAHATSSSSTRRVAPATSSTSPTVNSAASSGASTNASRTCARQSGAGDQVALAAFFPLTNIKGMEIDGFAVQLARVTLWMGHKLAVDELHLNEATLAAGRSLRHPSRRCFAHALAEGQRDHRQPAVPRRPQPSKPPGRRATSTGSRTSSTQASKTTASTGSAKPMTISSPASVLGSSARTRSRRTAPGRRVLNYIVEHGGVITSAVSTQDWPGEAAVDVSIVNWIKLPATSPTRYMLDGAEVVAIDTALEPSTIPIADVPVLAANRGRAFQGFLPAAKYDIDDDVAERLLGLPDAPYRDVVRRYIDGRDIARTVDQAPARWTIDFGQMPLENALQYPAALEIVRTQAKDAREASKSYARNPRWWQYLWPRPELRGAVDGLARYIIGNRVGKRFYWCFADPTWRPSDQVVVVALDSDYAIGILTSRVHSQWAGAKSSTLEDRLRYTPSSAFDTFPWPDVDDRQRARVGEAAREVLSIRSTLCREHQIGLTVLYNRIDDGAYAGLRKAHLELDLAVLSAYGWSSSLLDDVRERNRAIYDRNAEIITGRPYVPF